MVNCTRIIQFRFHFPYFQHLVHNCHHCTSVVRWLDINFCFNRYCMHPNHTWPSVILRFVQHRWMLFLILNLIVALCIIFSSCCSSCLQLVSTSSLMHFTLTLSVRYTEISDLLLVCKIGRMCTIPYHYDHYCTDNNKNLYIYMENWFHVYHLP